MSTKSRHREQKIKQACYRSFCGESNREIAKVLGTSHATINNWARSQIWKDYWNELEAAATAARLRELDRATRELELTRNDLNQAAKDNLLTAIRSQTMTSRLLEKLETELESIELNNLADFEKIVGIHTKASKAITESMATLGYLWGIDRILDHIEAQEADKERFTI